MVQGMRSKAKSTVIGALLLLSGAAVIAGCSSEKQYTYEEAAASFERHHFRTARVQLAQILADGEADDKTHLLFAKLMLELGDGIAAETALGKISQAALPAQQRRAMLAHSFILQGKPEKAEQMLGRVDTARLTEQDYRMLVWSYWERGDLADNMAALAQGLAKYPKSAALNIFAGRFALDQQDSARAKAYAERGLLSDPKDYEALILNGRIAIANGDLAAARVHYANAHENYPDHAIPIANMVGLDIDMGELKSAEKALKIGMAKHPRFPFMLYQKARFEFEKGDYENARIAVEEASAAYDGYWPIVMLTAQIEEKLGNREFAIREMSRVVANDPGNVEAAKLLASWQGS